MGSGPSKEKSPKKSSPQKDTVSKGKSGNNRNQIVSSIGVNDDGNTGYQNSKKTSQSVNNNSKENSRTQKVIQNGDKSRTTKGGVGKTKGFESDSESETDDINEVLEATRREHEERVKEQNYVNARHSEQNEYPETYAQRLQREQYKPDLGIIRQKTIYRNPEEWQVEDEDRGNGDGFDVNKFKQANAMKQVQNVQDRDIFSPSEVPVSKPNTRNHGPDPDNYYNPPTLQKQKSVPKYDMTEEALLAEIEKEYEF